MSSLREVLKMLFDGTTPKQARLYAVVVRMHAANQFPNKAQWAILADAERE